MIPIVNIAVTFDDGLTQENIEFARETLQPLYEDIEGVANVASLWDNRFCYFRKNR